jgi:hypothetical protein
MAGLLFADRIQETTTTTGTGTVTLAGAVTGYRAFSVVGDGNTCFYCITDASNWEVGQGTYTLSGTTLSRDTVFASSNSNALVSFGAGSKLVFLDNPADFIGTIAQMCSQPLNSQYIIPNSVASVFTKDGFAIPVSGLTDVQNNAMLNIDVRMDDIYAGMCNNRPGTDITISENSILDTANVYILDSGRTLTLAGPSSADVMVLC